MEKAKERYRAYPKHSKEFMDTQELNVGQDNLAGGSKRTVQ
jgi:hypothetical protein